MTPRKHPFVPARVCTCGQSEGRWLDVTDAQTGTAYMECRDCGTHFRTSATGYVDWHTGVFMGGEHVVGSEWTQQPTPGYFGRRSDVTQG